jgi:glucose-6-phosphate 1-dehydrogenase
MANMNTRAPACSLVIFGASGDLTNRKLIPALHSLDCEGRLAPEMRVLGIARTPLSDETFRDQLCEGVAKFGRLEPSAWEEFSRRLFYMPGDYDDPQTYRDLGARLDAWDRQDGIAGNRLFYLAIPPELYPVVVGHLGEAGLNRSPACWVRIIIEKPFGRDLSSAGELNNKVHAYFDEGQVYRIDHYLGKETVQNIMAFRFANYIFEEMWGRNYVDHIQITVVEDVGVERRGGYYDQAGVLRDMVQNHLLQLVALTAMEPPTSMNAKALRDEKVKVLQAVRPLSLADCVLGQYRGYRQEPGVGPASNTPTYVAFKLFVDNWRWQGVPFYLRSGKGLERKNTEITLQFKQVPHLIFTNGEANLPANQLSICIQPNEGMHLRFALKVPGAEMHTSPVNMDFYYQDFFGQQALPEAYERLLLDAIQGDASLFARSDEILRAWELVTPLLKEWDAQDDPRLCFYDLGSWGPEEGDALISRDGRFWSLCCDCH